MERKEDLCCQVPEAVAVAFDASRHLSAVYRPLAIDAARGMDDEVAVRKENGPQSKKGLSMLFIRTGQEKQPTRWKVPKKIVAAAVMGGTDYDFTFAEFLYPETHFYGGALLGSCRLTIPPGVRVRNQGFGLLGRSVVDPSIAALEDPNGPLLVVHGSATFGKLQVILNRSAPAIVVESSSTCFRSEL